MRPRRAPRAAASARVTPALPAASVLLALLPHLRQHVRLEPHELRRGGDLRRARPRQRHVHDVAHAARPRRHDDDPVGEEQRLVDVVGDEEDGGAHLLPHAEQQLLHRHPRLRVERGERLVHQHHARPVDEHPGDPHPLLHAARQLARVRVLEAAQPDQVEVGARGALALDTTDAAHLQAELHVAEDGLPREERVLLEDHAAVGAGAGDARAVHDHAPSGGPHEARHRVEHGGLPAAGRPEQRHELAGLRREVEAAHRLHGMAVAAERHREVLDVDEAAHAPSLLVRGSHGMLRAPTTRMRALDSMPSTPMVSMPTTICAYLTMPYATHVK